MSLTPKIEVKNLHKSFGTKKVLRGIDISVNQGESLVVIGGSGSGKSVLLKNIIGLLHPSKGSIKIDGVETSKFKGKKRDEIMHKFGYLFQGGALFDSMNVWENISFGLVHAESMDKKQARDIAIEKIESVGLSADIANSFPSELSGGMQKRVSLARAIATSPEIIFFDEPTTGLDPIMSDVINNLIVESSSSLGATTITITHDMQSAFKIADKMAMIYEGQFIWQGTADEINNSGNEYVDHFINGVRMEG